MALIVEFRGLVKFLGWVATSCVCTDIVLDGINNLQCYTFYMKKEINRVLVCAMTPVLG